MTSHRKMFFSLLWLFSVLVWLHFAVQWMHLHTWENLFPVVVSCMAMSILALLMNLSK